MCVCVCVCTWETGVCVCVCACVHVSVCLSRVLKICEGAYLLTCLVPAPSIELHSYSMSHYITIVLMFLSSTQFLLQLS